MLHVFLDNVIRKMLQLMLDRDSNTMFTCGVQLSPPVSLLSYIYRLVRADLPLVRHLHFCTDLALWFCRPGPRTHNYLVPKFIHQRDILFSLFHVHIYIGYKNYKIVKDVQFYQFRCTCCFFAQLN